MMRRFLRDRRGAAAVEFAIWLGILIVPTLSAVDLGYYAFQYMEVREAAQTAAQAAETSCGPLGLLPAVQNCTGLSSTLTAAAQATSLGTSVTVSTSSSSTWEGYYCAGGTPSNGLTVVKNGGTNETWGLSATSFPAEPADCSGTVSGSTQSPPGDYLVVNVTYTFKPVFKGISVATLLGSTITSTAWIRLG